VTGGGISIDGERVAGVGEAVMVEAGTIVRVGRRRVIRVVQGGEGHHE
jgi:hypothetical protein